MINFNKIILCFVSLTNLLKPLLLITLAPFSFSPQDRICLSKKTLLPPTNQSVPCRSCRRLRLARSAVLCARKRCSRQTVPRQPLHHKGASSACHFWPKQGTAGILRKVGPFSVRVVPSSWPLSFFCGWGREGGSARARDMARDAVRLLPMFYPYATHTMDVQ